MGMSATSLGKNGVSDWMVQRASAVILGVYFICLLVFFVCNSDPSFQEWQQFMGSTYMKVFTFLALLSLAGHAWVGLWTISTDYLTERQLGSIATPLRIVWQLGTIVVAIVYVVWGAMILWGA
ncbi:MAG: succinate dehydrogenase, hydrophobic membrane anchor protein [Pseudomonadales bacterium]|nr:succinate dehydrogenase, hydrophobic membrane anchor protein [Pseudomonadales bacterium]